jgi:hypothetical protein
MLIFGERHLRTVLAEYETHYNGRRPHRSRYLRPPRLDHPAVDLSKERIKRRPVLGGLINEYERDVKGQVRSSGRVLEPRRLRTGACRWSRCMPPYVTSTSARLFPVRLTGTVTVTGPSG